jgi:hypothetical protein
MSNRTKVKAAAKAAKAARKARGKGFDFNPPDISEVANVVRDNPYIQRLIEDAELRDNVREAVDSTRTVFERITNGKTTIKSLFEDKKLQNEIRDAFGAIRTVSDGLTASPGKQKARKAKKRFGLGRLLLLTGIGAGAAVATNEGLRSKLLDALFGAEEEFNYTPPATPPVDAAPPAGAPVSAA